MGKSRSRKLVIRRETLRTLAQPDLGQVAGAGYVRYTATLLTVDNTQSVNTTRVNSLAPAQDSDRYC